tara:strand:- start:9119 stop:9874 length:756 start_codon:yes stop_codon:yes gene_type:complete
MHNESDLLELAKSVAFDAGTNISREAKQEQIEFFFSKENKKEIKASADKMLEQYILSKLTPTGLSILTEESGYLQNNSNSEYYFILDPLDGTYNFVKDLGPSAISIALWKDKRPIFGVIFDLQKKNLFWGGKNFGSFCNEKKITVSEVNLKEQASICSGFPVRFNFESTSAMKDFFELVKPFAKVRMFGSAAISLVHVSKGSSEIYCEKNIMLWDVAAGLAIIEGSGGAYKIEETSKKWSYNVLATNGQFI